MLKNTLTSYGSMSRFLHWFMAICIVALLCVGFYMARLDPGDFKWFLYGLHKSIGGLMMLFIIVRIIWRLSNITPGFPINTPSYQRTVARLTHALLYVFMFAMPLSGIIMSLYGGHEIQLFWLVTIPSMGKFDFANLFYLAHTYGYLFLAGLIVIHVCAALYHHFWLKDNVMSRMLRGH